MEILAIVGVIFLTAVVFAMWVCAKVVGVIARAFAGRARPTQPALPPDRVQCPQPRCLAPNPAHARFCRRCGRAVMTGTGRPALRYVA